MASESFSSDNHFNGKDENGWTPLMHAVHNADISHIKYLLKKGANVNAQNKFNQTALMLAASTLRMRIVRLLLEAGAIVDMQDQQGQTALMKACRTCLKFTAEEDVTDVGIRTIAGLLAAGANPNAQDSAGKTPIMLLVMSLKDQPKQDIDTFEKACRLFCSEECFEEKAIYLSEDGSKILIPGAINPDQRMLPDLSLKDHESRTAYDIAKYLQKCASSNNHREHAEGFAQCAREIQSWHDTLRQDLQTHQELLEYLQKAMELAENIHHSDLLLPSLKAQHDLIVKYLENRWSDTSPLGTSLLNDDDSSHSYSSDEEFSVFTGNIKRGSRSLRSHTEEALHLPVIQAGTSRDTDFFTQSTLPTSEVITNFFGEHRQMTPGRGSQKRHNTYPRR